MKKVTITHQRAKSLGKEQAKAYRFMKKMEEEGYTLPKYIREAITYSGDLRSKKKYEELKLVLKMSNLKSHVYYSAPYYSVQYDKQGRDKYENEKDVNENGFVETVQKDGVDVKKINVPIATVITKETYDKIKQKDEKAMAEALNDLIFEQKYRFKTADADVTDTVWEIAKSMNGGVIPTTSTSDYEIDSYMEDGVLKTYQYDPTISEEQNKLAFYHAVKFNRVRAEDWESVEKNVMANPQTSQELYDLYMKRAHYRSSTTNEENLLKKYADKLNLPTTTTRKLLDLMHTSEMWHIASRGTYDSEQVLENWQHIYQDLALLEGVKGSVNTKIDELRRDITNDSKDLNVNELSKKTEEILKERGINDYKNNMDSYYNKGAATRWFKKHKQHRHGSKKKRK